MAERGVVLRSRIGCHGSTRLHEWSAIALGGGIPGPSFGSGRPAGCREIRQTPAQLLAARRERPPHAGQYQLAVVIMVAHDMEMSAALKPLLHGHGFAHIH